jgi:hypothetical protein
VFVRIGGRTLPVRRERTPRKWVGKVRRTVPLLPIRTLVLLGVLVLVQVPACRPAPRELWGEGAIRWVQAVREAFDRGIPEVLRFVAPDIVQDMGLTTSGHAEGRQEYGSLAYSLFGPTMDEVTWGDAYVDVAGLLVEERLGFPDVRHDFLHWEIGVPGLASRETHALAVQDIEVMQGKPEDVEAARAIAQAYLHAWSTADPDAVGVLYAPEATVGDSVLEVELAGRDAIEGQADRLRSGGSPAILSLDAIEGGGGPAIHFYYPKGFESLLRNEFEIVLAYTADDGTSCPGKVAVSLKVSEGLIEKERRFHEVESLRRCFDTDRLPEGWWAGLRPPPPLEDVVTGTVEAGGQGIEIHNGTPALERLVRWAVGRFQVAGLPAPPVASVAFNREAHTVQCSGEHDGLTLDLGVTAQVLLCLGQADACADDACTSFSPNVRLLILHELAHAWMDRYVDEPTRQAFLARMGLQEWYAPGFDWGLRGVEQAAQVIAWGLMDEPIRTTRLGDRSCGELAAAFELLTGAAPLSRRPTGSASA